MHTHTAEPGHRTFEQLNAALDDIRRSPRTDGVLRLIVRRPVVEAREVLNEGELDAAIGLVGDSWHARRCSRTADGSPHPDMQLTLMNVRAIAAVCADDARWPLAGDQLFVDLDLTDDNLPPGTRLQIGPSAPDAARGTPVVLEVTSQPHTGCAKFVERFGVDAMKWVNSPEGRALHLRGIYAKVVTGGRVHAGDAIVKLPPHA